jgi:TonB family protein
MTGVLSALAAYSVQLTALCVAAVIASALLRLRAPRPALHFWQLVAAAALLLPVAQPPAQDAPRVISESLAVVSGTSAAASLSSARIEWTPLALLVIAAGLAARLLWLAMGLWRLRVIVRRASPDATLTNLVDQLGRLTGAAAASLISDEVDTPATVGLRHPVILVPRRLLEMPARVQRAALVHELVHVRRRDWMHTIIEELGCAMLWFHPAARVLAGRLTLARETVVDEQTLAFTRDRRAYAEALLAFADPRPRRAPVTPLISPRHLYQRISLITQEASMSRPRMLSAVIVALALSGTATAFAAVTFPMSRQDSTVYKPGNGVTLPVVIKEVRPEYTAEAMRRKIQGSVFMQVVVLADGNVGDVQISQSLDAEYGLDQEAVAAAKQWQFEPGRRNDKPVAVQVEMEVRFRLK